MTFGKSLRMNPPSANLRSDPRLPALPREMGPEG